MADSAADAAYLPNAEELLAAVKVRPRFDSCTSHVTPSSLETSRTRLRHWPAEDSSEGNVHSIRIPHGTQGLGSGECTRLVLWAAVGRKGTRGAARRKPPRGVRRCLHQPSRKDQLAVLELSPRVDFEPRRWVLGRGAVSYERGTPVLTPNFCQHRQLLPAPRICQHPVQGYLAHKKRTPLGPP